jgi:hypothetical protein
MTDNVSLRSNPNVAERPLGLQLSYLSSMSSGRLHECDAEISSYQFALSLLPRSAPAYASNVYHLATVRLERYWLLNRQPEDDLEESILGLTETILSLPLPQDSPLPFRNINSAFHSLTLAIFLRVEKSRHPEDIKCSVIYYRYLRGLPPDIHNRLYIPVTRNLVCSLARQVESTVENVDQDIDEMTDLCDELLKSDTSTDYLTGAIDAFARTVHTRGEETSGMEIPSEKVIGCLRTANRRLPDLHNVSITLAQCFYNRFDITLLEDDYDEGMAILDEVISFRGPGDTPSPERKRALLYAVLFSLLRFDKSGKPEDLEQAIDFNRTLLDAIPLDHPDRDHVIKQRSFLQYSRFDGSGVRSDLELGAMYSSSSESDKLPSFRDLTASLPELSIKPLPMTTWDKHFNAFLPSTIDRRTDVAEIEDGVNYCRQLIASYPNHQFAASARLALGNLLHRAFECTNDIEYLNGAISASRNNFNTINTPFDRSISISTLIASLFARLKLLKRREDLNELIQLLAIAAENEGMEFRRLPILCLWASVARGFRHPSVSTAYDRAMSSMQACLTLAPTIDIQHSQLVVTMGNSIKSLPFDYASYSIKALPFDYASHQIDTSQLKQAIETLERGRALLWSEMRGLRTSLDQIRSVDLHLADNFATINQELETVTLIISSKSNVDGRDSDIDAVDPFGHHVVRQRKLLDDREKLILQIRALPGLDTFLKPPSFESLRSAARHGPVIIINHSMWRSDIIILHHNSPPSLITTSDDFYVRANDLQAQLVGARKEDSDLESNTYEDALRSVLKELYNLVGRPVI